MNATMHLPILEERELFEPSRIHAHRAIEQAVDLSKGKLSVILHGGEPMFVWDLVEDIVRRGRAYARSCGVKIDFAGQTNLTRVTDRVVAFSEENNIAWSISHDGLLKNNDKKAVLHEGSCSNALFVAVKRAYPSFVERCDVITTVNRSNQANLLELARYFRDNGVSAWDWSLFHPLGRGRDVVSSDIDPDVLLPAYTQLFNAVAAGEFDRFPVLPVKKFLDNFMRGAGSSRSTRAEVEEARVLLSLSPDGTVRADDNAVGPEGCAIALHAFDLISTELAQGRALTLYMESLP